MRRALVFIALCAAACQTKPPTTGTPMPGGLAAVPPRLAYLCVIPGCEEVQTTEISVRGSRRVAIKRVLLAGGGSTDFSFVPSETPPFIVGSGSSFSVDVTYKPKGAPAPGEAKLLVTYTDASPEESPDRLEPGEISIPLVRRIVGEPVLTVKPGSLQFGVVTMGSNKTIPVRVANEGFGNIVLEIGSVDAGHVDLRADLPPLAAMGPDAGFELPITFTPNGEAYVKATLAVFATAKEVPPAFVTVEGSSLTYPKLALELPGDVDFGLLPKGKTRNIDRQIVNQGGVDLVISSIVVTDPLDDVKLVMPIGAGPFTLHPLQRIPLSLLVDGTGPSAAGDVDALVTLTSNDPTAPAFVWHIKGTVTDPKATLTPIDVYFGTSLPDGGQGAVPMGWAVTKGFEIKNTGFGPLTVKNISMVMGVGTPSLFTLQNVPTLPTTLDKDAHLNIDVEFRAEISSPSVFASVSVESDDRLNAFGEVHLHAGVGMCGPTTCPISNGTPNCSTSGSCQIGMCNAGYYDTDGQASTGCECREVQGTTDPGEFCQSSVYIGNLADSGADATYRGMVPLRSDVDLVVMHGEDQTQFFSDDYDVKIRLDSTDPGIRMCVYHHKGGHDGQCYFTDESCPGNRSYRDDGSLGPDDGADYVVKVFRDASSTPTCTPYTIFFSNAR